MRIRIQAVFDVEPEPDETPLDTTYKVVAALGQLVASEELLLAFTVDPTETLSESAARKADELGLNKQPDKAQN